MDVTFHYPFSRKWDYLGKMYYPKCKNYVEVFLPSHLKYYGNDLNNLMCEINKTIIEEVSHLYSRSPLEHNFEDVLNTLEGCY